MCARMYAHACCYTPAGQGKLNVARMRLTGEGSMPNATEGFERPSGLGMGLREVPGDLSRAVFVGDQLRGEWRVRKEGRRSGSGSRVGSREETRLDNFVH